MLIRSQPDHGGSEPPWPASPRFFGDRQGRPSQSKASAGFAREQLTAEWLQLGGGVRMTMKERSFKA
jgi:hypothetical protein